MRTPTEPSTRVAVYERVIAASLTRIWENVLDWEHLPWLHRSSFGAVRLLGESADGWRGWITTRPRAQKSLVQKSLVQESLVEESLVEVELDRPALCYVSRTADGLGAGSEIWTRLEPRGPRATRIEVEFRVPEIDPELVDKIGAAYLQLYARLWDEDEAMMTRRQRWLDENGASRRSPAGELAVPLGPIDELRRRLPLVVRVGGVDVRLVAQGDEILTHPTVCPHLGGPLDSAAIEDGCITCPWHGYRYDLRTGRACDGRALALGAAGHVRIEETSEATLVW